MEVSKLNPDVLRKLIGLYDKRESLLTQLSAIERDITALAAGKAPRKRAGRPPKAAGSPKTKARRGRRGSLKKRILSILEAAGDAGARVKDIADQLRVNPQNVHVWFSSTGKKLGNIKRVDAGVYKLSAGSKASKSK